MRFLAAIAVAFLLWGPVSAQDTEVKLPIPVLIIDTQRVYLASERGQRIQAEIEALAADLQAVNEQIVRDLVAEEQDLAVRRPDMDPAAFRAEAEAFDEKAQDIRQARDAKEGDLQRQATEARNQFFEDLRPIIENILLERGGVVVLDSRSVYIGLSAADITNDAIAAVDADLAAEE